MSFVEQEDIINLGTNLIRALWDDVLSVSLPRSFEVLSYNDAMELYGSD